MANSPEADQFDAGVYQLEKTDPVLGGLGGASNAPLVNLANRTRYLYNRIAEILGISKNYSLAGGTANAITGAYTPAVTTVTDGQVLRFKGGFANTGATTFTPNSGGTGAIAASPIYGRDHQPLTGGEIVVNGACSVQWNAALNSGNGAWVLVENSGGVQRGVPGSNQAHLSTVGQIQSANYAVDTGAANIYAVALSPPVASYSDGMKVRFQPSHTSTAASTLNVNGVGAVAIVGGAHSPLVSGELFSGGYAEVEYNAGLAKFVLLECSGAPLQIAPGTQSQHALQVQQKGLARLTTSGSFVVPAGVTTIYVSGTAPGGAGGAGSGSSSNVGAGGGGGGAGQNIVRQPYAVTPGSTISVTIGAAPGYTQGNTGGGATGGTGGDVVLSGAVTLTLKGGGGGGGGTQGTPGSASGGGGGIGGGTGSAQAPSGSSGNDAGSTSYGSAGGGMGASGPFGGGGGGGRGGLGSGASASGLTGIGAGGGGGGGSYQSGGAQTGGSGGPGGAALVIFEW